MIVYTFRTGLETSHLIPYYRIVTSSRHRYTPSQSQCFQSCSEGIYYLWHYLWSSYSVASFPGPAQLSVACSTEKRGERGIFSHVSDVTTNKKLMNVGGLKHNGVIAHALVPESLCFMPSNRALRLPCKVYVFANGWRQRSMNGSPEWAQACPSAVHFILCWVKEAVCISY